MTHEDIQKLQSVGRAAQEERKDSILLDNSAAAWKQLSSVKDGKVDIVLDNGVSVCFISNSSADSYQCQAGFEVPGYVSRGDVLVYRVILAIHRSFICRLSRHLYTLCFSSDFPVASLSVLYPYPSNVPLALKPFRGSYRMFLPPIFGPSSTTCSMVLSLGSILLLPLNVTT